MIKPTSLFVFILLCFYPGLTACGKHHRYTSAPSDSSFTEHLNNEAMQKINIKIGGKTFIAQVPDNKTTAVFLSMLPLTVTMTDLNSNEKYVHLINKLPVSASNPGTIHSGDLMLWGENSLVIFYKTFSTSYRYTRLGRIEDTTGLAEALGTGNVTVTFGRK